MIYVIESKTLQSEFVKKLQKTEVALLYLTALSNVEGVL